MSLPINTELYLRNFVNDLGTTTADNPLTSQVDNYTLEDQNSFTLSQTPNSEYPVLVYFNSVLQYSPDFYTISGALGTLVEPQNGALSVCYWY